MSAAFAAGIDVVGELQTWGFGFTAAGCAQRRGCRRRPLAGGIFAARRQSAWSWRNSHSKAADNSAPSARLMTRGAGHS